MVPDSTTRVVMHCHSTASELSRLGVQRSPLLRARLGSAASVAARERTWERAMEQLADGYRRALASGEGIAGLERARAA